MLSGCTPWPEEFVDRYWMAGHWRGYTLDSLLRDWAQAYGPRTALVHGDTRITYAQLNRRVDRMAAGLRLRGMRPGQRVVVQLPNVPEFVSTVFALMRVGAIPVFCPLSYRAPEVSHLVRVTEAVGYVAPSTYLGFDHTAMAADIAAQGPFLRRVFTYEPPGTSSPHGGFSTDVSSCHYFPLNSLDSPPGPALVQSSGEVALFLLSGRTAETLKVIPRTHNGYAYQARAAAELVALTDNDVYLAALPAGSNFAFGCPGILGALSVGATVVLADSPEPAECLPLIERERVTITSLNPDAAQSWIGQLPSGQADLSSLSLVQIDGEAPRAITEKIGSELGCRPQRVFGMAEGLLTLTRPDDPDETVFTTQGRPLSPDDEIRILGGDGKDVPEGEPGELLARGPYTLRGYYRAPDCNARAFTADGYLRTGVLARRAADGNLVTTGRLAEQAAGRHG